MGDPVDPKSTGSTPILTDPGLRPQRYAANSRSPVRFASPALAVVGLVAVAAALILALVVGSPPRPLGTDAPAERFSVGRALPVLDRLVADGAPHPIGTPANAAMRDRVLAELEALGLEVTTQTEFACVTDFLVCGEVVNVITRLPGQVDRPAVLLTAHYDSVGAGPGVSDDLVGVTAIVETLRLLLAEGPLRNPFIAVLTDGEEVGLLGAEAFTHHPLFQDVGAVVNVEARGTRGQSMMFETNVDNAWLIDAFAREAPRPVTNSLFYEMYQLLPNDTDFSIYKREGLNGLNFAYAGEVAHYHTPLDDLEHLDRGSLQHQGDNVLAAARALGASDLGAQPRGNSLYIDLVPGSVLRVPESWAVPLAAACLLAWLLLAALLSRRRDVGLGRVVLGVVTALLSLAVATALAYGVATAVQSLSGVTEPWYASPLPVRVGVWLAALFGVVATGALFSRLVGFWGLAVGAWLVWALAGLATALALPGGAVVFLVPIVVATVAFLLAAAIGRVGAAGNERAVEPAATVAALLATFAAAYVWLPFALAVESLMGMLLSAGVAACLALAFITLTPLLAQAPRTGRSGFSVRPWVLLACLVGVAASTAVAVRAPTFSTLRPQRFTIKHVTEAAQGEEVRAGWLVDRYPDGPLPDAFGQFGDFRATAPELLPGVGPTTLSTAAPLLGTTPPALEVVSDAVAGSTRVMGLRFSSLGPFERLVLTVPRTVGEADLVLPGTTTAMKLIAADAPDWGFASFHCHGSACDGLEVELRLSGAKALDMAFDMALVGQRSGLPSEGAPLQAARPATSVPSQDGDVSVAMNVVSVSGVEPQVSAGAPASRP